MRVEPATVDDVDRLADAWVDLAREQRSHGTHLRPEENQEAVREDIARRVVVDEVLVARPDVGGRHDAATDPEAARRPSEAADPGDRSRSGTGGGEPVGESQGETLLGFVSFGREHGGYETDLERGIVHNLYVRPEYRDRGIGARLLAAAERRMAGAGVDAVALESMADNDAARRFYRRQGYRPHRVEFEKPVGDAGGE